MTCLEAESVSGRTETRTQIVVRNNSGRLSALRSGVGTEEEGCCKEAGLSLYKAAKGHFGICGHKIGL